MRWQQPASTIYLSLSHLPKAIVHLGKYRHEVMVASEHTATRLQLGHQVFPLLLYHFISMEYKRIVDLWQIQG